MSQTLETIIAEENANLEAELNSRVTTRLQSAKQSVTDQITNLNQTLTELEAEISDRSPQPTEPTGQLEGEVPVNQG